MKNVICPQHQTPKPIQMILSDIDKLAVITQIILIVLRLSVSGLRNVGW
jgi:hypothetical protein